MSSLDDLPLRLRVQLRRAALRSHLATACEAALLGGAAGGILMSASLWDGRPAFAPATLFCALVAAFVVALSWWRTQRKTMSVIARQVGETFHAADLIAAGESVLRQERIVPGISELCLERSARTMQSSDSGAWNRFFRPFTAAPLLLAAALFFASANAKPAFLVWQNPDDLGTQMLAAAGDLELSTNPESRVLAAQLREAARTLTGKLSPRQMEGLQSLHKALLRASRESAKPANPDRGSEGKKAKGLQDDAFERALSAIEREMVLRSGEDKLASGSSLAPAGSSDSSRISFSYTVPSQFEAVVQRYFERAPR